MYVSKGSLITDTFTCTKREEIGDVMTLRVQMQKYSRPRNPSPQRRDAVRLGEIHAQRFIALLQREHLKLG